MSRGRHDPIIFPDDIYSKSTTLDKFENHAFLTTAEESVLNSGLKHAEKTEGKIVEVVLAETAVTSVT